MEAKELMIGDWVSYIPEIEVGEDSYLGEPQNIQVDLPCFERIDELIFTPIPLTPEILEKNGWFEIWKGAWEGDIALSKEKDSFRIKNTNICLKYVHELQHALHLCRLKDIADNFKI